MIRWDSSYEWKEAYDDFMTASDEQLIGIWENGISLTNTEYAAYKAVLEERGINLEDYMEV